MVICPQIHLINYLGTDKYGNDWFGETQYDGSQIWMQFRNGKIINGGITPRDFNGDTGLSCPVRR